MMLGWFLSRSTMRAARVAQRGLPLDAVGGVVATADVAKAVRLKVALVDDPESQLVGKVEQVGVRRIVRGANRVDVVLLHEVQIAHEGLVGHRAPEVGVVLVTVHAAHLNGRTVDREDSVDDRDRAEPDARLHGLAARAHPQRV